MEVEVVVQHQLPIADDAGDLSPGKLQPVFPRAVE